MRTTTRDHDLTLPRVWLRDAPVRLSSVSLLRLIVILLGMTVILAISYSALTMRRFDRSNGTVGSIASRGSAGQTFIARYGNLSGIDVQIGTYGHGADPQKSVLVLHVRSSPGPGPDLATSTLPSAQPIGENSWYTFTFPPIASSQDRPLYFEIDSPGGISEKALTLYWWESDATLRTDPYPLGIAYRDGVEQNGDLAFGLRYSPAPIDAFGQALRGLSANFPGYQLLIVSICIILLIAFTVLRLPGIWRNSGRRTAWIRRWSLPFVLAVALLNGVIYLQTIPPWQGWDEHGHFMYAALLDKHGLDDRQVQALEWWDGGRDREEIVELKNVIWASMQRHNWSRLVAGYLIPGSPAPPLGNAPVFTDFVFEIRQPPAYYWLCAAAIGIGRSMGFPVDPIANTETALGMMRAISLAMSLGVVALAWLAAVLLSGWRATWLRLLLPLTVALLPMHTYIAISADNDILGELAFSSLFVALIALLRGPYGIRGLLRVGLVLLLTGVCSLAKSSAFVAALPLTGLGLMLWLGLLVICFVTRRSKINMPASLRSSVALPFALILLFVCLGTGAAALAIQDEPTAAGWQIGSPVDRAVRIADERGPDGGYVLQVLPGQAAYQWVDLPFGHPAISLTLSLSARQVQPGGSPPEAVLLVDERGRLPLTGAETLTSVEYRLPLTATTQTDWTRHTFDVPARLQDRKVMVRLIAGSVPVGFDNISLSARSQAGGQAADASLTEVVPLFNGSAEIGSRRLAPLLSRIVPEEQEHIIDVLINPQAYDKLAIARRYAYRQFRSFWGNFGWVSLPLPEPFFSAINALIVLALLGLVLTLARRFGRWSVVEWLGIVSILSLASAIIMGFAKQVAPLSTSGVHADPHGRYLFVLMVPIAWLLLAGLSSFATTVSRWVAGITNYELRITKSGDERGAVSNERSEPPLTAPRSPLTTLYESVYMPWGMWLWSSALFFFALYCLAALITPYYYG